MQSSSNSMMTQPIHELHEDIPIKTNKNKHYANKGIHDINETNQIIEKNTEKYIETNEKNKNTNKNEKNIEKNKKKDIEKNTTNKETKKDTKNEENKLNFKKLFNKNENNGKSLLSPNDNKIQAMIEYYQYCKDLNQYPSKDTILEIMGNPLPNNTNESHFNLVLASKTIKDIPNNRISQHFISKNQNHPIWKKLFAEKKIAKIKKFRNNQISITVLGEENVNLLSGIDTNIGTEKIKVPKYSKYSKNYWIDIINIHPDITTSDFYQFFIDNDIEIIDIQDHNQDKNSISNGNLRIYLNYTYCPEGLMNLETKKGIREIYFPNYPKPIIIYHKNRLFNRTVPPSILIKKGKMEQTNPPEHHPQPSSSTHEDTTTQQQTSHPPPDPTIQPETTIQPEPTQKTPEEQEGEVELVGQSSPHIIKNLEPTFLQEVDSPEQNKIKNIQNNKFYQLSDELYTVADDDDWIYDIDHIIQKKNEDKVQYPTKLEKQKHKKEVLSENLAEKTNVFNTTEYGSFIPSQIFKTDSAYNIMFTPIKFKNAPCPFKHLNTIIEKTQVYRKLLTKYDTEILENLILIHSITRLVASNNLNIRLKKPESLLKKSFPKWEIDNIYDDLQQWISIQNEDIIKQFQNLQLYSLMDILLLLFSPNIYINDKIIKSFFRHPISTLRLYKFNLLNDKSISLLMESEIGQQLFNNNNISNKIKEKIQLFWNIQDNQLVNQTLVSKCTIDIITALL